MASAAFSTVHNKCHPEGEFEKTSDHDERNSAILLSMVASTSVGGVGIVAASTFHVLARSG
jgi:hypothetical protein